MFATIIVNLTNVCPYLRLLSPCLVFGTIKCLILTHINGASTYPGVRVNLPRIWGRLTHVKRCHITYNTQNNKAFIANTPLQSRTRSATLTGAMCSTSQCELRSTFPNLRVTNVIHIVTYYTLPRIESPTSSWMTRSQRSRRRDKGLYYR